MVAIIVNTQEEIIIFNNGITPLMLAAGQIMERWVDEAQCPHNSMTNQYAIATGCTGTRREVIEQYLAANGMVEVEISQGDEDWFPRVENFILNDSK
jgi:hypothetical protein